MAVEAALSSSLSLIVRLSAPRVLECLGPLWDGVDDELHKLRRAMFGIQSIIRDAEERQVEDRAVKDWLTELKHAAYDAEDLLDQANTHLLVLRRKSELHSRLKSKVVAYLDERRIRSSPVIRRQMQLQFVTNQGCDMACDP